MQDSGRIYRGSAAGDGAPSSYFLGASAPSNFDNQVGFDTQFDTGTQIGAFLFDTLAFTAAPASISTTDGPSSLAFIAINGITAAPASAATIDISALTQVLLATRNGPITLSNVTFTDDPSGGQRGTDVTSLTFYARGSGNVLDLTANLDVGGSISLYGEGGLNFNQGAQALSVSSATLISGADMTIGGTIDAFNNASSAISATANGNLTITTSGVLNTTGPLNLTSGGTFQSDGLTSAGSNTLNITSTGDLITTSDAQITADTINLTASGALSLDGNTLFSSTLTASSVGDLNIYGVVGGDTADNVTPQALGTASFTTSNGNLSISGQITADTINLTANSGNYSTTSPAAITANTININAPNGNVSLSASAYLPTDSDTLSTVNVSANTITVPDQTFTPLANQSFNLTQPGAFTVPSDDSYTFNSLTLTNPDTNPNGAGDLILDADSVLNLNTATVNGSLSLADGSAFTVNDATIAQSVTLTGAATLNINGLVQVNNNDGNDDAFTATGASTINLGLTGSSDNAPELYLPVGSFNGGDVTINGSIDSTIQVSAGDFSTTSSVTLGTLNVSGNVMIGDALVAANVNIGSGTVGALSTQNLTSPGNVFVNGDVTPYNFTFGDNLSAALLGVSGSLNYAAAASAQNAGQLTISLQSGFNLGVGSPSVNVGTDSYATSMDFSGTPQGLAADNVPASNGGSLTIITGNTLGTGDFTAGNFAGTGTATVLDVSGGRFVSTGSNGSGGNGGHFEVDSAGNINLNTKVTINAYGGDFTNTSTVTGPGTPTGGNGGTVTLSTFYFGGGAIAFADNTVVDLHGGAVGAGGASGGTAGNGGTLTLNGGGADGGSITLGDGTGTAPMFNAKGGLNSQSGISGNGGSVSLASVGTITLEPAVQIFTDGGALQGASGTAGNGGTITLQASGDIALGVATTGGPGAGVSRPLAAAPVATVMLTADGGTANQSGLVGGNGGKITINSDSTDQSQSVVSLTNTLVSATTGGNSMTTFGGTGGTISITATDTAAPDPTSTPPPAPAITLYNTVVVASDDGTVTTHTPNSHSQVGGTITVSTMRPSGPGILIEDSSKLTALVNAGSTGAGGTINLLSAGATIEVDNSTLTTSGTNNVVQLNNQAGSMYLSGATLTSTGGTVELLTAGMPIVMTEGTALTATGTGSMVNLSTLTNTPAATGNPLITLFDSSTLSADQITLQSNGAIILGSGSSVTAGSSLTINGPEVALGSGTNDTKITASNTGGTITIDTPGTTAAETIKVNENTVTADTILLHAQGSGGTISILNNYTASNGTAQSDPIAAQTSLTLYAANINVGGSLTADPSSGFVDLNTYDSGQTGKITLNAATVSAGFVLLDAEGTGGTVNITNGSSITSSDQGLNIDGATIQVTGSSVTVPGGTFFPDTMDATQKGLITFDDATVSAGIVEPYARGVGGTVNVVDGSSITGTGIFLRGANIQVTSSTLTSNGGSGLTLDTLDPTQKGTITVNGGTLSSVNYATFYAEGQGGTVSVTNGSSITGVTPVSLEGANVQVTGSTLTSNSSGGAVNLLTTGTNAANAAQDGVVNISGSKLSAAGIAVQADGTNGTVTVSGTSNQPSSLTAGNGGMSLVTTGSNGSITVNPDSTLSDPRDSTVNSTSYPNNGVLSLLAEGTTGSITVGTSDTSNTDATTLSADTLKLRAMGTNGSLIINGNSTLSATTQLLLYADGSNGKITFQGGNITLNTGTLAGILAAPTITITTGTVVTVNGSTPIQVYTNTANYSSDYGGNNTQTGVFAGTAQPSGTPQPFASKPAYPNAVHSTGTVPNTVVPATTTGLVAVNTPKTGNAKTTGTPTRPRVVAARPVTIPFSALNPKDLSFDPSLLKGGPQATAAVTGPTKAGKRNTVGNVSVEREKVRATAERRETSSTQPAAGLPPGMARMSR